MIDSETLQRCREVNLHDFLMHYDRDSWKRQGKYLRNTTHDSCVIDASSGHWFWNSLGLYGTDAISFLKVFYGLPFQEAVQVICSACQISQSSNGQYARNLIKPLACPKPWSELYTYLCDKRCLDKVIIDKLIIDKLIFLSEYRNCKNIVFCNPANNHLEIIGTTTTRFKQCSDGQNAWLFKVGNSTTTYICESAIDAISLFQLQKLPGIYISVCGSANRMKLVQKLRKQYPDIVLAFDNDAAGTIAASFAPELKRLVPITKDWNEDLQKLINKTKGNYNHKNIA